MRLQGCNQLDQQAVLLQRSCDLQGSLAGGQPGASDRVSEAGSCRAISAVGAEASRQDSGKQLHCAGCTLPVLVQNEMTTARACREGVQL